MADEENPSDTEMAVSTETETPPSAPSEENVTASNVDEVQEERERTPERIEEDVKPPPASPPQQRKKSEIFLRDEQVPYLYESLRGKDIEPPVSNFITCSDPICDEYIEFVARTGRPLFEWSILKSLLLWKLEMTMADMAQAGPFDHLSGIPNTDRSSSRQYMERILSASRTLTGVPFTIQRICELLIQPKKHYKRADKFYRALEKNITVVTTVDGEGRRETERQPDEMENLIPEPEINVNNAVKDENMYNHVSS